MAETGNSEEGRRAVGIACPGGEEALDRQGTVALAFHGRLVVESGDRLAKAFRGLAAYRAYQRGVVGRLQGALEGSEKEEKGKTYRLGMRLGEVG